MKFVWEWPTGVVINKIYPATWVFVGGVPDEEWVEGKVASVCYWHLESAHERIRDDVWK